MGITGIGGGVKAPIDSGNSCPLPQGEINIGSLRPHRRRIKLKT